MNSDRQHNDELRDLLWSIEDGTISAEASTGWTNWFAATRSCCINTSSTCGWFPTCGSG